MPRPVQSSSSYAVVLLLGLLASSASAADLVIYAPDGQQDPAKVTAAFAALQSEGKKSGVQLGGQYFVQFADFQKFLEGKPAFGVVDAIFALDNAEKLGIKVLAIAHTVSGSNTQPYCLLVSSEKKWTSLAETRGSKLAQTPLAGRYPYFAAEFIFEGSLPADHFVPKAVPHATSALRAVELGESDAALVPCANVPAANKALKVLYTSRPIPMPVLVSFEGATPEDSEKVKALFVGLLPSSPLLHAMGFGKFTAAPPTFLKTVAGYRDISTLSFDDLRVGKAEGSDGSVSPSPILSSSALSELRSRLLPPQIP